MDRRRAERARRNFKQESGFDEDEVKVEEEEEEDADDDDEDYDVARLLNFRHDDYALGRRSVSGPSAHYGRDGGSSSSSGWRAASQTNLLPPQPVSLCQVENCIADMSGSKQYYKRHKVCEFHAKAQIASVAGLQQRFCQQCSRFHLVAEFDDIKRSCRRRLAGHNQRRRKSSYESG